MILLTSSVGVPVCNVIIFYLSTWSCCFPFYGVFLSLLVLGHGGDVLKALLQLPVLGRLLGCTCEGLAFGTRVVCWVYLFYIVVKSVLKF